MNNWHTRRKTSFRIADLINIFMKNHFKLTITDQSLELFNSEFMKTNQLPQMESFYLDLYQSSGKFEWEDWDEDDFPFRFEGKYRSENKKSYVKGLTSSKVMLYLYAKLISYYLAESNSELRPKLNSSLEIIKQDEELSPEQIAHIKSALKTYNDNLHWTNQLFASFTIRINIIKYESKSSQSKVNLMFKGHLAQKKKRRMMVDFHNSHIQSNQGYLEYKDMILSSIPCSLPHFTKTNFNQQAASINTPFMFILDLLYKQRLSQNKSDDLSQNINSLRASIQKAKIRHSKVLYVYLEKIEKGSITNSEINTFFKI